MSDMRFTGRRLSVSLALVLVGGGLGASALGQFEYSSQRRFAVLLAAPSRSIPNWPNVTLPNPGEADRWYFDTNRDNDVYSFREYWSEISYGKVDVTGTTNGWVEIPWRALPNYPGFVQPSNSAEAAALVLPHNELNGFLNCQRSEGEQFDETQVQFQIDWNGDAPGNGNPPSGYVALSPLLDGIWTPGERFIDINNNGKYDALTEVFDDGLNDPNCLTNGTIDNNEVCDLDGDDKWDFAEPFEDFMRVYLSNNDATGTWVRLDPSPMNDNVSGPDVPGSAQWSYNYIIRNYVGPPQFLGTVHDPNGAATWATLSAPQGTGFLGRFGNQQYDPPERWIERGSSKLQQRGWVSAKLTFEPAGADPNDPNVSTLMRWFDSYYKDRYTRAFDQLSSGGPGVTPNIPATPPAPVWETRIPNMVTFNQALTEPNFAPPWEADRFIELGIPGYYGGVTAVGDPNVNGCDPNDPTPPQCTQPTFAAPSLGTGTLNTAGLSVPQVTPPAGTLPIQPDRRGFYDGPAEYDDMPSSLYHNGGADNLSGLMPHPLSGISFHLLPDGIGYENGGDGRFGEVTAPRSNGGGYYGYDNGPGGAADGVIRAAGPWATDVHGISGADGGNVANLELLTWCNTRFPTDVTDPNTTETLDQYIARNGNNRQNIVFCRDANFDGLLDLGETRIANTENYAIDLEPGTNNNGGGGSNYPFSRSRLTEDVIEVADTFVDWDDLIMQGPLGAIEVHCTTLVAPNAVPEAIAPGGRGLWVLPAPSMNLPIQTNDRPDRIQFSDFAAPLDALGEGGVSVDGANWQTGLMQHEWLHVWQFMPDLYDYDEYFGGYVNRPVGVWDIMANGPGHPTPPLKAIWSSWVQVTPLETVLNLAQETEIQIDDYAFDPAESIFYYTNALRPWENFWFFRNTFRDPVGEINFQRFLPGEGVMIMHTDLGEGFAISGVEGFPIGQTFGTRSTFRVVQADGLTQLENGELTNGIPGDDGDPFQDGDSWNDTSVPNNRFYDNVQSGLEIRNIVNFDASSIVTFFWNPRIVPTLTFKQPAALNVINNNLRLRFDAFDLFAGTDIQFFFDTDGDGFNGTPIGGLFNKQITGELSTTFDVPLSALPGDGEFYFYAQLIPGLGVDGQHELQGTAPVGLQTNRGRAAFEHVANPPDPLDPPGVDIDTTKSRVEAWTITCLDDTVAGAELWQVRGSVSGVQPNATTGVPYVNSTVGIAFTLNSASLLQQGAANVSNANGVFTLTDPGASFVATDFLATDHVRITGGSGVLPGFYRIKSVPNSTTLILSADAGDSGGAGNVTYRVHAFTSRGDRPDRFQFLTTGFSAYSFPVNVETGAIIPPVDARIAFSIPSGSSELPLRVQFSGSNTRDEFGQVNPNLVYTWTFDLNDPNSPTGSGENVEFTYERPPTTNPVVIRMQVVNPATNARGEATVEVSYTQRDIDGDGTPDIIDNCPDIPNEDQLDSDGDGLGNVCDPCPQSPANDVDNDGRCGNVDNCPTVFNPSQTDSDGDGLGDACDVCPNSFLNDLDGDGVCGDLDACPLDPLNDQDQDGVCGDVDNCPLTPNADQLDSDGDGIGDACQNTTPPGLVSAPNPAPGATKVPLTTTLTWAAADGAQRYLVSLAEGPNRPFLFQGTTTTPAWLLRNLKPDTQYVWNVAAENSFGTTLGPAWSFRTLVTTPPADVEPNAPASDDGGGAEPPPPTGDQGGETPETPGDGDAGQDQPDIVGDLCGAAACGGNTVGWLPLTMLTLMAVRGPLGSRRVRRH